MGQRSQIYVKVSADNKTEFIARYFQWNYGERMVSRARGIIEYVKTDYLDHFGIDFLLDSDKELKKLTRIAETNFDLRDVLFSADILKGASEYNYDDIFYSQDNNDGQLYIDVTPNGIKYAFVYSDFTKPLSAEEYLNDDFGIQSREERDFSSWKEMFEKRQYWDENDIAYTEDNIRYIEENATLMTEEEVKEFHDFDYTPFIRKRSNGM